MEFKNDLKDWQVNVCIFVCGLLVGGVMMYLMARNGAFEAEDDTAKTESVYPQVYGIDVSFWQGHIRWNQLALPCEADGKVNGRIPAPRNQRSVQFAFIRATKSNDLVDSLYQRNYDEAKQLGIPCGTYHFLTDTVPASVQAELFLSHARLEPGDLPPVLDVEIDSPDIVSKAREWLEIVEKKCGVNALIYTNMQVLNNWVKSDPVLSARDLWLAKPRGEMPEEPNCKFWQFSHEGHVWGIIDNVVDLNMFNGTHEELQEYIRDKGIK
jgi:lysozyme